MIAGREAPRWATGTGVAHLAVAVALAASWLVVAPSAASAHEVGDDVRYVLDEVPEVGGVTVQVVRTLAPQLVLASEGDATVEVLDTAGEPFLRIGPGGVEADVDARAWRDSLDPGGIPADAEVPDGSRWVRVREEPSWGWFDHRLHERDLRPTGTPDASTVLDVFEVRLRIDGRDARVAGRIVHAVPTTRSVARLTGGRTPLPGVDVQLLAGPTPGLLLRSTERTVEVAGADGEPFLRVGPAGVEANDRSPTWWRSGRQGAPDPQDAEPAADAEPRWIAVGDGPGYAWLDPRLAAPEAGGDDATPVRSWVVPVSDGAADATVTGELRVVARERRGGPGLVERAAPAALALGGIAASVWAVRRRRTSSPSRPCLSAGAPADAAAVRPLKPPTRTADVHGRRHRGRPR